jgi:hypothetical protein
MSFINWGNESPEQLAMRRRLEEQALYEQSVRMAQARQRAGNSQAGVGGGSLSISPCIKDKLIVPFYFYNADVLQPSAKQYIPTANDLDTIDVTSTDKDTALRAYRDEYEQVVYENLLSEFFYKRPATGELPSPMPETTMYFPGILHLSPTSFWCTKVSEYGEWSASGASVELPNVTELTTLVSVELFSNLPESGNPGEIIWVSSEDTWYAWNKNTFEWSSDYYDAYISQTHVAMRESSADIVLSKSDIFKLYRAFLFAAKYIPEYRIKKDNL